MTTSVSDGSQTAVISTEHTLDTITAAGAYEIQVDTSNMALGDILVLRAKTKVRSVGTTRLHTAASYSQVQGEPVKTFQVSSANETVFTLEQTAGTGRAYNWEILQLDA